MLSTRPDILEALEQQVRRLENARLPQSERVSSSCAALDKLLPGKGFRRGTLVEWLADAGSGAAGLAFVVAREAGREGGALAVIDPKRRFYPPAAAALGIELARTVFVRPRNQKDQLWALNQTLSCPGVAAVVCGPEKLDDRAFRRIQLAAERGQSLGLLLRPTSTRGQPTGSEIQLLVTAVPSNPPTSFSPSSFNLPSMTGGNPRSITHTHSNAVQTANNTRHLRVEILRSRGGKTGVSVDLEFDDEQGTIEAAHPEHLASALAAGAPGQRSSGA